MPPLHQLPDGALFYALLPFRVARYLRENDPDADHAECLRGRRRACGLALARRRTPVVRCTATGALRRASTGRPFARRCRRSPTPFRAMPCVTMLYARCRRTRRRSQEQGVTPADSFRAWISFRSSNVRRRHSRAACAFIGVLEAAKNIDGLADGGGSPRTSCLTCGSCSSSGTRADVVQKPSRSFPNRPSTRG